MNLQSTAFKEGEMIPSKFTCDGENISPELNWSGSPGGTKTFALIVEDPDAQGGIFVHWVLYNIPAGVTGLPEGTISENLHQEKLSRELIILAKMNTAVPVRLQELTDIFLRFMLLIVK
jgi:Raf kinase inhibitor-like YbhB/YbcL family protein